MMLLWNYLFFSPLSPFFLVHYHEHESQPAQMSEAHSETVHEVYCQFYVIRRSKLKLRVVNIMIDFTLYKKRRKEGSAGGSEISSFLFHELQVQPRAL
jgi:hypothetical protein